MKMTFTQNLLYNTSRPIIENFYGGLALIDTGADIPVCSLPEAILMKLFDAELKIKHINISGFGGEEYGNVYTIKLLQFKNLIYPNIPVFVPKNMHGLKFRWILSATMFDRLEYSFNMKRYTMTVNIPDDESNVKNLRVYDTNGNLHILCES